MDSRRIFVLGVDSPFFATIVLLISQLFPCVCDGFLKRRIPKKNGEGSPRFVVKGCLSVSLSPSLGGSAAPFRPGRPRPLGDGKGDEASVVTLSTSVCLTMRDTPPSKRNMVVSPLDSLKKPPQKGDLQNTQTHVLIQNNMNFWWFLWRVRKVKPWLATNGEGCPLLI